MPPQPGTKETFLGAFLANIVYGLYFAAFIECCTLLWRKHKSPDIKQIYLMATTGLMFILITMEIILSTYRCTVTFDTPDADIGPPNSLTGVIMNSTWLFVTPIADAFIIFRTFVVWGGNWWIVLFPISVAVVGLGASIWNVIALTKVGAYAGIWGNIAWEAVNTFLSASMAVNVICTALISFRILQMRHRLVSSGMSTAGPGTGGVRVVTIIVESAAVYSLMLVATIITTSLSSFVNFIFLSLLPPTIGVVFSYIIIRVSRGTSYGDEKDTSSMKTLTTFNAQRSGPERFELSRNQTSMISSTRTAVQVRLDQVTQHDRDAENGFTDSDYIVKN